MKIVAMDFETATTRADSACALALVTLHHGEIADQSSFLFRPPRRSFQFTYLHGISWDNVRTEPTFSDRVPEILNIIADADYLAAHNAGFDRKVLYTCMAQAGQPRPTAPFVCTLKIARRVWRWRRNSLDEVCRQLNIPLDHHNHASDALACARILQASMELEHPVAAGRLGPPSYSIPTPR